jgi:hypothetical protein
LARCYRWRAASTPSKLLACADHVSPRAEQKVHNVSQARDAQPDRMGTSGDRRPRRTLRADAFVPRGVRYARTIINAHHVSYARMQLSCALHVPHYTVQALRARGKLAVSRLTSRFRIASYCHRVDLVCD